MNSDALKGHHCESQDGLDTVDCVDNFNYAVCNDQYTDQTGDGTNSVWR